MALVSSGYRLDIFTGSSPALQPVEDKGSWWEAQELGETPRLPPASAAPSHLHPKRPREPQLLAIHPALLQPMASAPLGFQAKVPLGLTINSCGIQAWVN